MAEPSPYDHYRLTDGDYRDAVYRVVGTGEEVALLEVGDADGKRVNSGRVVSVPAGDLESDFEPAENPDAGFSPWSVLEGPLLQLRMLPYQIRSLFR